MNQLNHPDRVRPVPARPTESGFTLVEIMVVIVILGLLATLVARNVIGASDEARITKAKADCSTIASAVRSFRARTGRMPESLDELVTKNERGMSELEELNLDPWDTPYELIEGDTPREFEVISCGPDRSPGTEDDISNKSKKDE